jgi:hypothetical protein
LLSEIEDSNEAAVSNKMKQASDWLGDALAGGPVAVIELEADAKAEGIAWRTVKRGIKPAVRGFTSRLLVSLGREGPRVCRLAAGGGWIRTIGPATE